MIMEAKQEHGEGRAAHPLPCACLMRGMCALPRKRAIWDLRGALGLVI